MTTSIRSKHCRRGLLVCELRKAIAKLAVDQRGYRGGITTLEAPSN